MNQKNDENKKVIKSFFTKEQILSIPNLLSLVRFLLIPVIVLLYCGFKDYRATAVVVILSALTDVADGIIARKFNMITDLGKILDPMADKMTQVTIAICLATRYSLVWVLLVFFVFKEVLMAVIGWLVIKKGIVTGAKWYGKLNTVVLFCILMILILFPSVSPVFATVLICIGIVMMAFCLFMYQKMFIKILRQPAVEKDLPSEGI